MRKVLTKIPIILIFALSSADVSTQNICSPWVNCTTLVPFQGGSAANNYRNDDAGSGIITLPFSFCFYGTSYNTIDVCNNGYITFPGPNFVINSSSSYIPQSFPINGPNMIAPFWADVETLGNSSATPTSCAVYGQTTPTHIIIEWDSVGYFASHFNYLNSFEMILTNGSDPILPNGNNLAFIYRTMQWAQGDITGVGGFNGPNGAVVGVNDANGVNFMQFGIFDNPSSSYFGPNPPSTSDDGVAWLNNRELIMNTCNGHVIPIISTGGTGGGADYVCDTFKLCLNNTLTLPFTVWTPLVGKTVHSGIKAPIPPGVSITYNVTTGQLDSLDVQIVANTIGPGIHTFVIYGYDNEVPSDSNFTTVTVDVLPKLIVHLSAIPPVFCQGSSSVLTALGGAGDTYLWSTSATTSSISVAPIVNTTYTVQVTNAGCSTVDTAITVVVNPLPVISVTPINGSVCGGDSLQLNASGAATYTWAPATGLSCINCSNPKAAPTVATQYTITGVSAAGCPSAPITDSVEINAKPTVTASTSQDSLCYGHSANLNAVGSSISYTWAPGIGLSCTNCQSPSATPLVSITYTVTGTDVHGCTNTDNVYIYVTPPTPLVITGRKTLCLGDSETLVATSSGNNYTWQPGGFNGASLPIKPNVTTQYTVSVPTPCGTQKDSFTVYVSPKPVAAFTSNLPDSGCLPLCVQFNDQSHIASGTILDWKWEYGNGDTLNIENSVPPPYCYNGAGTFNVGMVITSDSGCKDSVTQFNLINTFSHPAGSFTYAPYPVTILDPIVQFTNSTKDAYGMPVWHWDFGERGDTITDTVSILRNPTHTYADTGTYCVQLISENRHGCIDTVVNCVIVESQFIIYIPSAFTPNANGHNDVFLPAGNYKTFEMYIYDRWGMEVFHTTDMTQGWNGQVHGSGSVSQQDTYIYLIKVTDQKNAKHSFTGEVNLLR